MMDAYSWGQAEARHDQQMIDDATAPYGEKVVGQSWNDRDVYEDDDIIKLWDDTIVFDDKDDMLAFINDWLKDASEGDLADLMTDFFDGKREEAEDDGR